MRVQIVRAMGIAAVLGSGSVAFADGPRGNPTEGEALFLRTWTDHDPRAHGGDGLGPVFNARSCVSCHFRGGMGGSGTAGRNVDFLSATRADGTVLSDEDRAPLAQIHEDFRSSPSVVVHQSSTDPRYAEWRDFWLKARANDGKIRIGSFVLNWSQRNSPPLFGLGAIDAIPDSQILNAVAAYRGRGRFPEIRGRVPMLPDGRIGRFGWKAQVATLDEFIRAACAGELGLEVPGRSQWQSPRPSPAIHSAQLDMTERECASLVAFVRSLPRPVRQPSSAVETTIRAISEGARLFKTIGCASCHRPNFAGVSGIYSDLIVHEMGSSLSDSGLYYETKRSEDLLVTPGEWRTPPLWGVAQSAPYLHDGRAATLDEAIRLHGGEASPTASRYVDLTDWQRGGLEAFLKTLIAPPSTTSETPDLRLAGRR